MRLIRTAVLGAVVLGSCTPAASGSRLPEVSFPTPAPQEGAALFRLHVAVDSSSDNRAVGQYLVFERASPPLRKMFAVFDLGGQDVFLVSLPPGTYVTSFEVYSEARLEDGSSAVKIPASGAFAAFEVKQGAVTPIGGLAFTASVTRQTITTHVEIDPTLTRDDLVRLALGRPEARARGWSEELQVLLPPGS
jgi:hypothetical protein